MWERLLELWVEPLASCHGILGRDYILGRDQTPCREGFLFFFVFLEESREVGMESCVGGVRQGNY